jgi:hypothetical protein
MMFRRLGAMNRKRGSVTVMWVVALPVYILIFMLLASLVIVWVDHSVAQKAADAGSLAATKKMDEYVNKEVQERMQAVVGTGVIIDPYEAVLGTPSKRYGVIKSVRNKYENEIKQSVSKYIKQNGAEPSKVIFFVDGRVRVEAKVKFHSLIFSEQFRDVYVKGVGFGPKRDYAGWTAKMSKIEIPFEN